MQNKEFLLCVLWILPGKKKEKTKKRLPAKPWGS